MSAAPWDGTPLLHRWRPGAPAKICICGGGSLSHALAAVLGAQPGLDVRILTRQPQRWSTQVRLIYLDKAQLVGRIALASAVPSEVVPGADLVLLCVPHCARAAVSQAIAPYLSPHAWVAAVPGYGGFPWCARDAFGSSRPLIGFQRVPYVRKTVSYGQLVWVSGIRPQLFVATVPAQASPQVSHVIEALLNIPTTPLASHLAVCLSNSNPIFHPARLYALWRDQPAGAVWPRRAQFYEEWNDAASEIYLACESDLQAIAASLPADLSDRESLLAHYRLSDPAGVTATIRAISALRDRPLPMHRVDGGWGIDRHSHYFTEDFPFGIVAQRALADLTGVATPTLDRVIQWGQRQTGREWLSNGRIAGRDAKALDIPQRYGIGHVDQLMAALK